MIVSYARALRSNLPAPTICSDSREDGPCVSSPSWD